ncbi:Phospholipid-transporting ATPase [Heracleum sosnowskyi]|uniref:Phospholipid-transporting ATPase n=1 Tax=Heracleum sosnowskyi TaxID=360622 RepID=A0AAD8JHH3_9APIA|nr:Phospholipid-transporting ATPase [Heracleum sosnowskyi]
MARRKLMARLRRSNWYTFSHIQHAHHQPAEEQNIDFGYPRTIYCNQNFDPYQKRPSIYCGNDISTTKYSVATFLPIALHEQFNRVANIYFLIAAVLSTTPYGPFSPFSAIAPLAFVVGLSMTKELVEDWRRFLQDRKVNMRDVDVHIGGGFFGIKPWKEVMVGDVIKVHKDQFFPADLLLLSSVFDDGMCYVETMNLDGETNLKAKRALEATMGLVEDGCFTDFNDAIIRCEETNSSLYTFVGNIEYDSKVYNLDPNQILLRDSKLRNTDYVYGVAIYTGHETKVMQNSTKSPSKRSRIEKQMDKVIYILFTLLILVSAVSSLRFAYMTTSYIPDWWYLKAPDEDHLYDPDQPFTSGVYHLITALILYGYLIPISLYVSIELVKVLQASFINKDMNMYDYQTQTPAQARTSNLNEELGQVGTILSDKTGTLTCNQMDFLKCSIAGIAYGTRVSEVELAAAKKMARDLDGQDPDFMSLQVPKSNEPELECVVTSTGNENPENATAIKGFSFEDTRLMNGNWSNEKNADIHLLFFRILAVCHTAIPEVNEETGALTYEAESPDEGTFLVAGREFGFEYFRRTQASIFVREMEPSTGETIEREFKLLNLLDFTSKRKRMSVIVRDEEGRIFLFCKGADTIIFDRLSEEGRMYQESTTKHLHDYGDAGLRTLVFAYRKLEEADFKAWNDEFMKVKNNMSNDRDETLERLSDEMEKNLILVGATAVEDKLQEGVPKCIDRLAQAGLKIWVLTGDKMETAINIGFSCSLLRQGMQQIFITTKDHDTMQGIKSDIMMQITGGTKMINVEKDPHAAFALIIDGKTLTYALEDEVKHQFLNLAVRCASVICCRVSPKQKALVTRLVKEGTGNTTLAIGDGANDVGMIQEADIGVGISGVEGMQAVMSSDFAIAQFRFLERLLVVHGHWCYKRIAQMICYFFYKNIAFGLTIFYYEACTGFSGSSIYDDWYMILYNVAVTSLPVISLGVFEQDVSSEICLQFPALYQQGPQNLFFGWYRIIGWMCNGVYTSLAIFFLNILAFTYDPFRSDGQTTDMSIVGAGMFTTIVCAVNVQIALSLSHFTWIQHILILGSVIIWFIFLIVYGSMPPEYSHSAFHVFVDTLAPSPIFWIITSLVVVACNFPYFIHIAFQRSFSPMDHHVIQEMMYYKKHDRHMWKRERRKGRKQAKFGFTARVDAKIRQLKHKLHRKPSSLACKSPDHGVCIVP